MTINIANLAAEADAGRANAQTVEEFERVLEIYAKTNPEKYAAKLASGELERFRSTLVGYVPEAPKVKPVEELSKSELLVLAKEKGIELEGTETKAELVEKLK